MKKAQKKTIKKVERVGSPYVVTLKVMGKIYKANGVTLKDAINGLSLRKVAGVGVLMVERGDKTKEKIITVTTLSRLFSPSRITHEVALKNISVGFDL